MKSLIVALLCTLVLQGCTLAHDTSSDVGPQPIVTMTSGSWR